MIPEFKIDTGVFGKFRKLICNHHHPLRFLLPMVSSSLTIGLTFGACFVVVVTAEVLLWMRCRRDARERLRHRHRIPITRSPAMPTFARAAPPPHSFIELYPLSTTRVNSTTSILDISPQLAPEDIEETEASKTNGDLDVGMAV
jgi:hypothetical protein